MKPNSRVPFVKMGKITQQQEEWSSNVATLLKHAFEHQQLREFMDKFPPILYRLPADGTCTAECYAPPIPLSAKVEDVKLVGSYPDSVVLSLAAERDDLRMKVYELKQQLAEYNGESSDDDDDIEISSDGNMSEDDDSDDEGCFGVL